MKSVYQEIGKEEIKTGNRTKNWNEAKWIEFIEELIKKDRAEQLLIQRVSQRSELLPKITPHLEGHEPMCDCEPCDLLRKIFGNCG